MTNEPTNKTDAVRPQEPRQQGGSASSGSQPISHPSGLTQNDPTRRAFGDKTDDASKKTGPSKVEEKSGKVDAPRYDKGPRADAMNQSQGERSFPSNQPKQQNQKEPQ